MQQYKVTALWDEEAKVWVATSDDVPGLVTEADTVDELLRKLQVLLPELLEENNAGVALFDEFPFSVELPIMARRLRDGDSSQA